ncbi:phage tail protein I [Motilimonas sp. 1_MG-2023]|uniref:phage tail protein I n=1 Tax=Motilimonas sp. 1_MG-2023 TaxID=3062672 RepID=UPI0026E415C5|nr:phage tail protein I [Motilimonas sp. 1_MG-2023]MDO6525436.1 phage tail protein I [Motilimonas sp. 1_MG-2023]
MSDLLPPSKTSLEKKLAQTGAEISRVNVPLHKLWDADNTPEHLLPWLAWALGVEDWSDDWSEQTRRAVTKESIPIRRLRGTLWAVRRALETLGYKGVEVIEHANTIAAWQHAGGRFLTGDLVLDGSRQLGIAVSLRVTTRHWAQYALGFDVSDTSFTQRDQQLIRKRVERAAPLRSELVALIYRMGLRWENIIKHRVSQQKIRMSLTGCAGFKVHRAGLLFGCRELSGINVPSILEGARALTGHRMLLGVKPAGRPFPESWGTSHSRIVMRLAINFNTEKKLKMLGRLSVSQLDGKGHIGSLLDGQRRLEGKRGFGEITLGYLRPKRLLGAHQLGSAKINSIGTTATGYIRRGRHLEEVDA